MTLLRRLSQLILILAVILSGAGSAVARSEMAGLNGVVLGGAFVLCGGDDALGFDPQGHPVSAHHACPHCLAAGALAVALDAPPCAWTAAEGEGRALVLPALVLATLACGTDRPMARGPPARA